MDSKVEDMCAQIAWMISIPNTKAEDTIALLGWWLKLEMSSTKAKAIHKH